MKYLSTIAFLSLLAIFGIPSNVFSHHLNLSSEAILAYEYGMPERHDATGEDNLRSPIMVLAQGEEEFEDFEWDDEEFDFEDDEEIVPLVADPLVSLNRVMFHINDRLYFWVLKPVAQGYRAIMPLSVRKSVKSFFYNITSPVRFVSCLLQGKGHAAGGELARFMANTTIGLVGIFDVTQTYPELNPKEEDLGQVFGVWGFGNGFYLYLPFYGPSTFRDTLGRIGNWVFDPTFVLESLPLTIGIKGIDIINATSFRIGDYESLKDAAIEPYEAFRDAYIQYRNKALSE